METQTPYSVNPETIFSGHWIVAQQGMGKTNLLLHMLSSDLKQNASIIIMDSKGELTRPIRKLSLGERLIVLDPKQPFGINPLDASTPDLTHTIEQLLYIFGVLLDAAVPPMQEAFRLRREGNDERPNLRAATARRRLSYRLLRHRTKADQVPLLKFPDNLADKCGLGEQVEEQPEVKSHDELRKLLRVV